MFDRAGVSSKFGKDEIILVRELFGFKPGENPYADLNASYSDSLLRIELEAHKETLI
jgi:hypothetical protein